MRVLAQDYNGEWNLERHPALVVELQLAKKGRSRRLPPQKGEKNG